MGAGKIHRLCLGTFAAVFCMAAAGTAQVYAQNQAEIVPGIYALCSAEDETFVLDQVWCTENDSAAGKGELQMYHTLEVNQQKFYLEQLSGDEFRITGLTSGQVLTIEDADLEKKEDGLQVSLQDLTAETRTEPADTQVWHLEHMGGSLYYIRSDRGAYLTRSEDRVYSGEKLTAAAYTGRKNQRWVLRKAWIGSEEHADTDYINPYEPYGRSADLSLTMTFGEEKEEITSEMLASWVNGETHEAKFDQEQLKSYVQSLAERHDTVGKARNFKTSYGKVITLYKGDFGWKLDVAATAKALSEKLDGRSPLAVSPVWSQTGGTQKGINDDIGDSYVEVDLLNQKVWLYKQGEKILETDCVSGTYGTDRQTPGGVYDINGKRSPAVLRGPGYESPVSYWMPFNGGIGLHDATWRSTFGGDIYRTNGSHGCINLPLKDAETIYENVTVGYPVVCYS